MDTRTPPPPISGLVSRHVVALDADEEAAAFGLLAVLGPNSAVTVVDEVLRRTTMFEALWASDRYSRHETPTAAALRSVTADIAAGRL